MQPGVPNARSPMMSGLQGAGLSQAGLCLVAGRDPIQMAPYSMNYRTGDRYAFRRQEIEQLLGCTKESYGGASFHSDVTNTIRALNAR